MVSLYDKPIKMYSTILKGLHRLEYRGYDSWGFELYDGTSHLNKNIGDLPDYDKDCQFANLESKIAIGHTRWATDGKVDASNAHPHLHGDIALVHNGIITNIDHVANNYHHITNDSKRLCATLRTLNTANEVIDKIKSTKGSNAFLLRYHDYLYAAALGKPLYIGKSKDAYIITSEAQTLSGLCDKYIILENDVKPICNHPSFNSWMRDYEKFDVPNVEFNQTTMIEEIGQQKDVISSSRNDLTSTVLAERVFVGCGSSYNAAKFGKLCYNYFKMPARAEYASEFRGISNKNTEVIGITQSGETKDLLDIKDELDLIIVNNTVSSLARECDYISMDAGPEFAVAATKSFTMSCIRLLEMAASDYKGETTDACRSLLDSQELKTLFSDMFYDSLIPIKTFVKNRYFDKCIFMGSGFHYPIAREGALKMKEVAYIPSDAMPAAEVKHGPIALVDEDCLCVISHDGALVDGSILENIKQVKSRGATVINIGPCTLDIADLDIINKSFQNEKFSKAVGFNYPLYALINNVALQLLAYYTAVEMGLDPNRPRNLAKTVTV